MRWFFGERRRYFPSGSVPWWRRWGSDAGIWSHEDVAADPELAAILDGVTAGRISEEEEATARIQELRKRRVGWREWTRRGLPW